MRRRRCCLSWDADAAACRSKADTRKRSSSRSRRSRRSRSRSHSRSRTRRKRSRSKHRCRCSQWLLVLSQLLFVLTVRPVKPCLADCFHSVTCLCPPPSSSSTSLWRPPPRMHTDSHSSRTGHKRRSRSRDRRHSRSHSRCVANDQNLKLIFFYLSNLFLGTWSWFSFVCLLVFTCPSPAIQHLRNDRIFLFAPRYLDPFVMSQRVFLTKGDISMLHCASLTFSGGNIVEKGTFHWFWHKKCIVPMIMNKTDLTVLG